MSSIANRRTLITLALLGGLLSTLMLGGCLSQLVSNEPGGNMRSNTDSFTYISTPF